MTPETKCNTQKLSSTSIKWNKELNAQKYQGCTYFVETLLHVYIITLYSCGKEITSALNITVKREHYTHFNTGKGVQHVNIMMMTTEQKRCRHEFFEGLNSSHE